MYSLYLVLRSIILIVSFLNQERESLNLRLSYILEGVDPKRTYIEWYNINPSFLTEGRTPLLSLFLFSLIREPRRF